MCLFSISATKSLKADKDLDFGQAFRPFYFFILSAIVICTSHFYWRNEMSSLVLVFIIVIAISVVRRLKVTCDFLFLAFISSSLLPNTTNWPRINKQPWVFFLVTHTFCWVMKCHLRFQPSASENHLPSHQVQKTLQFIKFYPYHLISSDLIHYHQILSYCSLEVMETYFTGDCLEKLHWEPLHSGKPGLAQP